MIAAMAVIAVLMAAQQPPRDAPPVAAVPSQSVLHGRVTDASGQPLGRTFITIADVQPGGARTAITDDDGRYAIDQLPAGRFIVWATRAGFLSVKYGQDASGLVESRVVLTGADRVEADFVLTPGAAISGTVVDGNGDPVVSGVVHVRPAVRSAPRRVWDFGHPAVTDGRGAFRVWGLQAGEYLVFATAPQPRDSSVPPGAVTVRVAAGEEMRDVALVLLSPPPAVRVEGTALGPDGLPIRGTRVQLVDANGSSQSYPAMNPDGTFVFRAVPAGRYVAVAQASHYQRGGSSEYYWGTTAVHADGSAPVTTAITMTPGAKLSGRVVLLSTGRPADFTRVRVTLSPLDLPESVLAGAMGGSMGRDGTFTITGVPPGRYTIRVELSGMMADWTVQSAAVGGVDALDVPIRIDRSDVAGVNVTLTDRPARLTGVVRDERGEPAAPFIVLYSMDPSAWLAPSRRWVRAARPDTRGGFEIAGLPAGPYHVALVERLPETALSDAAFLRALKPRATVTLTSGDAVRRELVFRSR